MTDPENKLIVNPDQTTAQLGVAIRYFLTLLGGYLVGKGWIDGDLVQVMIAGATAIAPAAYAAWRAHKQKATLREAAEDPRNKGIVLKGEGE